MSREKQIEEMAFDLCMIDGCKHLPQAECRNTTCAHCEAEALYNAGYRKASEVAREIFEDLETYIDWFEGRFVIVTREKFAELKKKYTEGGE